MSLIIHIIKFARTATIQIELYCYCFHGAIFTGVLNPGQFFFEGGVGLGVWHEVEQTNCN